MTMQEKEYYCPEPPDEDGGSQCIDIGPEFSSDFAADGPDSHDQSHDYTRGPSARLTLRELVMASMGKTYWRCK